MSKYTAKQLREMNKTLQRVYEEVLEDMDAIEIPYNKPDCVSLNTRSNKTWGVTHKKQGGIYTIDINSLLCESKNWEDALYETLAHELCHTCDDCMNHGDIWWKWVGLFNSCYGTNIKQASTASDKGIPDSVASMNNKYQAECPNCGTLRGGWSRECKLVKDIKAGYCTCNRCGSKVYLIKNW